MNTPELDSYALFVALWEQQESLMDKDPWWWPNSGSFTVVVGALLTQQARWPKVEESLANLDSAGLLELQQLALADEVEIKTAIRPSGFYNHKARRLHLLARHIVDSFGDFQGFKTAVTRDWLLSQTGVGEETADAILCYACNREVMVVDAYTTRLLQALGLPFNLESSQQWIVQGLKGKETEVLNLTGCNCMAQVYALYHGAIVEYAKQHSGGKTIATEVLVLQLNNSEG